MFCQSSCLATILSNMFLKEEIVELDTCGMNSARISLASAAALLVLVTGCSDTPDSAATQFEARWQCTVQRQAFDDLAALDAALERHLDDAGLTRDDYQAFKTRLETSSELRQAVADEYDAFCLEA